MWSVIDCAVPGCVFIRVVSRSEPHDSLGIHVHPDGETLSEMLTQATSRILEDERLS